MMKIKFKPTKKQHELFQAVNSSELTEILFGGAAGTAKSYGICSIMILKCLEHPGIRIGLGRNELKNLKKTTLVSFFEVADDLGIKDLYTYNSQAGTITFQNGSVIQFVDLAWAPSDPEYTRFGGLLLTLAFIDEVGEVDSKAYSIYKSRVHRWKNEEFGIRGKVVSTCNPVKGWLKRRFYDKHKDGTIESFKTFIPALPTDNPYLPPEYIENLRQLPLADRQRLLYGNWEWDDSPLALIPYESVQLLYSEDDIYKNESDEMYITSDIAFTGDKFIALVWRGYELIEIHSSTNATEKPEDVLKELAQKYQVKPQNILYDADGVGLYLKNYFRTSVGFHGNGKVFKKENYRNLKTQVAYKFADMVNKNKIRIRTSKNKDEIEEELSFLQSYNILKENKMEILPKTEIKKVLGHSPDFLDALIYRGYFEYKSTDAPRVRFGGATKYAR